MCEGSAYTDFTACIIIPGRIRQRLVCAREEKGKTEGEVTKAVSFTGGREEPTSGSQLSPVNRSKPAASTDA